MKSTAWAVSCSHLPMPEGRKYWEIIADNLSKAGYSWGMVGYVTATGRCMWALDARKDGPRFVVNADDLLAGFLELEAAIKAAAM